MAVAYVNQKLPSRATARVAPTIHGIAKTIRRIVGATLAVALEGSTGGGRRWHFLVALLYRQ